MIDKILPASFQSIRKPVLRASKFYLNDGSGKFSYEIRVEMNLRLVVYTEGGVDKIFAEFMGKPLKLNPLHLYPNPKLVAPVDDKNYVGWNVPTGRTNLIKVSFGPVQLDPIEWDKFVKGKVTLIIEHGFRRGCLAVRKNVIVYKASDNTSTATQSTKGILR